mgnify:CR=1 FL=1
MAPAHEVARTVDRSAPAPDDGGGAMAGAAVSGTQRVQFAPGTSGMAVTAVLDPNTSVRYVLGASEGQVLNVDIGSHGGALDYRIENPDGIPHTGAAVLAVNHVSFVDWLLMASASPRLY